jgi:phospholipase D1/2
MMLSAFNMILFLKGQTMSMTSKIVSDALLLDAHPQDDLDFYCLGKRELARDDDLPPRTLTAGTLI